jgi:hypothetical protein
MDARETVIISKDQALDKGDGSWGVQPRKIGRFIHGKGAACFKCCAGFSVASRGYFAVRFGFLIPCKHATARSSVLAKKKSCMRGRHLILVALAAVALQLTNGCTTMRQTDPARTATEQLLLSTAADRATEDAAFAQFAHKKVFLDTTYFDSYDSKYAIGAIRDALSRAGALLMAVNKDSEITIEARSGALSTDDRTYLLGLPAMGVPIPLAGTVSTPEVALYKSSKQHSTAKFALLAYTTQSREHVFSSGSMVGKAYDNYFNILIVPVHRTDVPEMKKKKTR